MKISYTIGWNPIVLSDNHWKYFCFGGNILRYLQEWIAPLLLVIPKNKQLKSWTPEFHNFPWLSRIKLLPQQWKSFVSKWSISDSFGYTTMLRYGVTPEWFSYHLRSHFVSPPERSDFHTPLIRALCTGLVRRSVTQTPIRCESYSAPIAIRYSVTGPIVLAVVTAKNSQLVTIHVMVWYRFIYIGWCTAR